MNIEADETRQDWIDAKGIAHCTPKFNGWSNPQAVLIAGNDGTEYVRNVLVYSYTMFKKYVKFRIIILYVCIFRLFLCLTKIQKLQQIA